jgi:hypothetical protein
MSDVGSTFHVNVSVSDVASRLAATRARKLGPGTGELARNLEIPARDGRRIVRVVDGAAKVVVACKITGDMVVSVARRDKDKSPWTEISRVSCSASSNVSFTIVTGPAHSIMLAAATSGEAPAILVKAGVLTE